MAGNSSAIKDMFQEKLGLIRDIYELSSELQKLCDEEGFDEINNLLKKRQGLIDKVILFNKKMDVNSVEGNINEGVKLKIDDLIKKIQFEDEKLRQKMTTKKESISDEVSKITMGQKTMGGYRQKEESKYAVDVLR